MNIRLFLNVSAFVGLGILAIFMVRQENIEVKTEQKLEEFKDSFVKYEQEYRSIDREDNLALLGMQGSMVTKTLRKIEALEKQETRILQWLRDLRSGEDAARLIRAFCASEPNLRPRYEAAAFLIKEDDGKRRVIKVKRGSRSALEYQPWASAIDITQIHGFVELKAEPRKDATVMFIAAVLLDMLNEYSDNKYPFDGDLKDLVTHIEKQPERTIALENEIMDYFALMHLTTEIAQNTNSKICNSE